MFLIQDYISTHSMMFRLDSGKLISVPLAAVQIFCFLRGTAGRQRYLNIFQVKS